MRASRTAFAAAILLTVGSLSVDCRADQPPQVLDDVVVTGERTGPGMWHVRSGAGQLWILGSMSPLPKGITWRSTQVEQVLGGANPAHASRLAPPPRPAPRSWLLARRGRRYRRGPPGSVRILNKSTMALN